VLLEAHEERSEAPIEPDHEPVVPGRGDGVDHAGELGAGQRKGLLDKDGLAALESRARERSV
jgi:hypothetical protein